MNAVIIANGQLDPNERLLDLWRKADLRIAADGGARHAREAFSIAPHVIVGDMDSIDAQTKAWLDNLRVETIQHPRAKNKTDLELAIDLAQSRGAQAVTILGAFGGRSDQMLANILLLTRVPHSRIVDDQSEMWVAKEYAEIIGKSGDTISLIPLSETVEGIQTTGLVFPLKHETLTLGTTRGISNEMDSNRASIGFDKGLLLVVHLFSNLEFPLVQ